MNEKTLKAINDIRSSLNELHVLTKDRAAEYFYERLEMNILIELIEKIENSLTKISNNIKNKYSSVPWNIIENKRYNDEVFGSSMKLGDVWELASSLYDALNNKLNDILNEELESYYHKVCIKRQEELKKSKI